MIIGIDEVGDFATYSQRYNFFVATLIDQAENWHEIKKVAFENWENNVSEDAKEDGEIKGRLLSEKDLKRFTNEVIRSEKPIRIESVCFIPSDNSVESMEKYKEIQINSIDEVLQRYINKCNEEVVAKFEKIQRWFSSNKKVNYQHFMKMLLLNKCISIVHKNAIGVSILLELLYDKEAKNLLNMEFKIDQNFLDSEQKKGHWKGILRNYLLNDSKENPVPLLDTWEQTGHPFLDKYKKDGQLNLKDLFENHCDFVDSKDHFEVRIAEIVGTIFHRKFNKEECQEVYESLFSWKAKNTPTFPHGIKLDETVNVEEYKIK